MALNIRVGSIRLISNQFLKEKIAPFEKVAAEALQERDDARQERNYARKELDYERTEGRQGYFSEYLRHRFIYLSDTVRARKRIENLLSLLVPHKADNVEKVRLGRSHDGGYASLDDFSVDAVFSLGISNDVSWDEDVLNRGQFDIYQYDHTVDDSPIRNPRFRFHKKAIGLDEGSVSITQMLRDAGISKPASAFLKIDIEHAEWPVFAATPEADLNCFSQIVGEFHGFDEILSDKWYDEALQTFTKLSKHFRLVHVHGNNYASQIVLGAKLFPRCLEMTFANTGRYNLTPSGEVFPSPLDMPCCPDRPEIILDKFQF